MPKKKLNEFALADLQRYGLTEETVDPWTRGIVTKNNPDLELDQDGLKKDRYDIFRNRNTKRYKPATELLSDLRHRQESDHQDRHEALVKGFYAAKEEMLADEKVMELAVYAAATHEILSESLDTDAEIVRQLKEIYKIKPRIDRVKIKT